MGHRIEYEYRRALSNYGQALIDGKRYIDAEIDAISKALESGGDRFYVRQGLVDLARNILDTEVKLMVFSNLSFIK